jgi:ABC-type phosphate transport system ATPase subunit
MINQPPLNSNNEAGITSNGGRTGYQVEYGPTKAIFENPQEQYTKDYLSGEFS